VIAALLLAVSLEAQQHFAAGLKDLFAYASETAASEFQAASKADPTYALARWGEALALGSDLNTPLTAVRFKAAHDAIARALPTTASSSRDAALIEAARARYAGNYGARSSDERTYHAMMESFLATYPDDDDAAMILVEDLLEQHGMTWTEDGKPLGETSAQILSLLNRTLVRDPRHLFANHLCIHAYDNAPNRTPAITCAQALDSMVLAEPMEHLAHMPAHVWLELGDGKAALRSSERAWSLSPTRYAEHDAYIAYSAAMMCGDDDARATWAERLGAAEGEPLPAGPPPFVAQAKTLEAGGKTDDAIALLEKSAVSLASAREMIPPYPADVRIGAAYFRAGKYTEARAAFGRVLASRPRDPRALYGSSQALLKLGDVAGAARARAAYTTYWAGAPLTMNDF
jgi:tetratricopeptide (TPR) repeat protein